MTSMERDKTRRGIKKVATVMSAKVSQPHYGQVRDVEDEKKREGRG